MEPAEPMGRIEPADPTNRIDPLEPMLRIDPEEPIERRESPLVSRMGHSYSQEPGGRAPAGL